MHYEQVLKSASDENENVTNDHSKQQFISENKTKKKKNIMKKNRQQQQQKQEKCGKQ